jgi:hypothetical protein
VSLPGPSNFSDEATGLYANAVTSYADTLELLARHCAIGSEVVVANHVKNALSLIGPAEKSVLLDWIKRSAFLFAGIAITLGIQLFTKSAPPVKSDVTVFVVFLVLSTVLLVTSLNADMPWIRRKLLPRH